MPLTITFGFHYRVQMSQARRSQRIFCAPMANGPMVLHTFLGLLINIRPGMLQWSIFVLFHTSSHYQGPPAFNVLATKHVRHPPDRHWPVDLIRRYDTSHLRRTSELFPNEFLPHVHVHCMQQAAETYCTLGSVRVTYCLISSCCALTNLFCVIWVRLIMPIRSTHCAVCFIRHNANQFTQLRSCPGKKLKLN